MSNKIKIKISDNKIKRKKINSTVTKKNKIVINFDNEPRKDKTLKEIDFEDLLNKNSIVSENKPILFNIREARPSHDKSIYKLFKKNNFSSLDLHGYNLEDAKKILTEYCFTNSKKKNSLHIIITGLGNKPGAENFYSGKIRSAFLDWIMQSPLKQKIYSYHPCKIQHGGLGAYYIKLKIIK